MSSRITPELGDKVKCKVTGLTGIIVALSKHLWGCDRIGIQPPMDKDGKIPDFYWADIDSVDVTASGAVKGYDLDRASQEPVRKPGGPALRGQTPTRSNPK